MGKFKECIIRQFEKIIVAIILISGFFGTYFIEEEVIVLNFYYLPVIVAGYFLGRRTGVLTAVFSVLAIVVFALLLPHRFFSNGLSVNEVLKLSSWGGFLILASVAVGTLYEQNEKRLQDLKNAYIGILEILSKYLESTDPYTKGHSVRVSELATEIAAGMNLTSDVIENTRVAGLLHDIGKIDISGEILRKAAQLTVEEKEMIDSHAVRGGHLLSSVGAVLKEVVPIVIAHHEYFADGEKSREMPLPARIIAVADSFDAMVTDRPYRKGMPPWKALEEVVVNTGKQFDPEVVSCFKQIVTARLEKA